MNLSQTISDWQFEFHNAENVFGNFKEIWILRNVFPSNMSNEHKAHQPASKRWKNKKTIESHN